MITGLIHYFGHQRLVLRLKFFQLLLADVLNYFVVDWLSPADVDLKQTLLVLVDVAQGLLCLLKLRYVLTGFQRHVRIDQIEIECGFLLHYFQITN